jgi:hypothetical protein
MSSISLMARSGCWPWGHFRAASVASVVHIAGDNSGRDDWLAALQIAP